MKVVPRIGLRHAMKDGCIHGILWARLSRAVGSRFALTEVSRCNEGSCARLVFGA
jgi:hypothetical protein